MNKKTPGDIGLNAPEENTHAPSRGFYIPIEFGSQIQAYHEQRQYLSAIPEAMAGIVESFNDYAVFAYDNDAKNDLRKAAFQHAIDEQKNKTYLKMQADNRLVPEKLKLVDQLAAAQTDAENNGRSIAEATAGVLSEAKENEDIAADSPYVQGKWAEIVDNMAMSKYPRAVQEDIDNQRAYNASAIDYYQNAISSEILQGNKAHAEGFDEWTLGVKDQLLNIPKVERIAYLNKAWNSFVLAEANNWANSVQNGIVSPEIARQAIASLIKDSAKEIALFGEDGEKYQVSLTAGTQSQLMAWSAKVGHISGSATGDGTIVDVMATTKEYVEWDKMQNGQYTRAFDEFATAAEFNKYLSRQKDAIFASNAKPEKKAEYIKELNKMSAYANVMYNVRNWMSYDNGTGVEGLRSIVQTLRAQLNSEQAPEVGWAKYTIPGVKDGQGNVIPFLKYNNEAGISNQATLDDDAKIFFSAAADMLDKLLNNIASSENPSLQLLSAANGNYSAAMQAAEGAFNVVEVDVNNNNLTQNAIKSISDAYDVAGKAAEKAGYDLKGLPDKHIEAIVSKISSDMSLERRSAMVNGMADIWMNKGMMDSVISYMNSHPGNAVLTDIVSACYLNGGMRDTLKRFDSNQKIKVDEELQKVDKEAVADIAKVVDKYGLQGQHRYVMMELGKKALLMEAYPPDPSTKINAKHVIKQACENNFIHLNSSTHVKEALFKGSYGVTQYQNSDGSYKQLEGALSQAYSWIAQEFKDAGMSTGDLNFKYNSAKGVFEMWDGRGGDAGKLKGGAVLNLPSSTFFGNRSSDVGNLVAYKILLAQLAYNPEFRKGFGKSMFIGSVEGEKANQSHAVSDFYTEQDLVNVTTAKLAVLNDSRKVSTLLTNVRNNDYYKKGGVVTIAKEPIYQQSIVRSPRASSNNMVYDYQPSMAVLVHEIESMSPTPAVGEGKVLTHSREITPGKVAKKGQQMYVEAGMPGLPVGPAEATVLKGVAAKAIQKMEEQAKQKSKERAKQKAQKGEQK